jgi:hypothetical protein
MRRLAILSGVVLSLALASPTLAAKPNNQACLGHDVSGYAAAGAGFGGFISGLASTGQGVGDELQAHLAGQVPDSVIPNSCND